MSRKPASLTMNAIRHEIRDFGAESDPTRGNNGPVVGALRYETGGVP